ncbi:MULTISPECIES: hypothetical protein [unclassified Psychrobacter]|uniref:hypothetical protein n=1 Tax=unclassified Psychrobacter TaxID=196806 RepID=UPI0018F4551F|nr:MULTISPECIES: hypothetical protein [unclassified Psychrobacter]
MSNFRKIKIEMLSYSPDASHASAIIDVAGTSTLIEKFDVTGLLPCQRACELIDAALVQQGKALLTDAERIRLTGRTESENR